MAISSGTAANYLDLLGKIRDFVVAQPEWEQIGGQTGAITSPDDVVALQGSGLTGDDAIFVTLGAYATPVSNLYGLRLRGHTSAGTGIERPGANSPITYLPTLNSPIGYWIIVNGRRFIVIVKTSARYDAMYAGLALPEHLPADWAYPLFVGASSPLAAAASSDLPYHSNFWNPISSSTSGTIGENTSPSAAYLFSPIRSWLPIRNGYSRDNSRQDYYETGRVILPWARQKNQNVRRLLDGTPTITRAQLVAFYRSTGSNQFVDSNVPELGTFYGGLDGVFYTPAFGATAEQELTLDGKTYMCVPNIARNSNGHYAAILME